MLLQELVARGEQDEAPAPTGFQARPIRYEIWLDGAGVMRGSPIDLADAAQQATRNGVSRLVPEMKRSGSKPKPLLLVDTVWRILALPREGKTAEWVAERHQDYADLVRACATATGEPSVVAIAAFLEALPDEGPKWATNLSGEARLGFRVDGVWPTDLPAVQRFWAAAQGRADDGAVSAAGVGRDSADASKCLVCGRAAPLARIHPVKIKGIPCSLTTGSDLVSANEDVYESYGLKSSLIAPTCDRCAETYANTLNDLLRRPETHLRLQSACLVYAFWTRGDGGWSPVPLLADPDPTEVKQLIAAFASGTPAAGDIDDEDFFALGLGASGARAVVRSWLDTTVGTAKTRKARWFALQEVVAPDGSPGSPLPLWRLTVATVREGGKEGPSPATVDGLIGLALAGTPVGGDVLAAVVRRCKADQGVRFAQAALIKLALCSRMDADDERIAAMTHLDQANPAPAYLCGRLLAVLEAIQRQALGTTNATLIDKFYGSASTAPASVFGTLLANAQNHLARLRKERRGVYVALDGRLEGILAQLHAFPPTLTLPDQGLFALGFYHQRAEDRRAARERAAARDGAAEVDASMGDAPDAPHDAAEPGEEA